MREMPRFLKLGLQDFCIDWTRGRTEPGAAREWGWVLGRRGEKCLRCGEQPVGAADTRRHSEGEEAQQKAEGDSPGRQRAGRGSHGRATLRRRALSLGWAQAENPRHQYQCVWRNKTNPAEGSEAVSDPYAGPVRLADLRQEQGMGDPCMGTKGHAIRF